jgi:HD-GYP domain-containing protein (c-di-GMP phosphodiesterase class II)
MLRGADLDSALEVAADFIDLKSPFTAGHSRQVAALAAGACQRAGLPEAEVARARRAGLVHDLGRTAVPNSIWDKPAALTRAEFDRVELHPLLTEQMLHPAHHDHLGIAVRIGWFSGPPRQHQRRPRG